MRTAIAGVLLALGTVGVSLLAVEAACRLAGYRGVEQYQPDDELGWVLEPGQSTVTTVRRLPVAINGQGFRDEPMASPKPPGVVRIFALGASTTFGWGVRQEEAYPQVLEQMLNDSARAAGAPVRFEIVNAGVIGYNLWQVGRLMRRIAARYQPDGFVVAYTFNDAWNRAGRLDRDEHQQVLRGVRRKNVLRASALFNWLTGVRARRVARQAQHEGAPNALAIAQTADTTPSRAELARYSATVDSIIRQARDGGFALAFIVPSARGQPGTNQRQEATIYAATAARMPLIQPGPLFGAEDPDSIYLPEDAVHPTALGHALLARRLYLSLCESARRAPKQDPASIYRSGCGGGSYNPRL